jgi:hypothetical protein
MSGKNFGPAVSGYLNPTGRNWETTVFQAGKPVLDKELNLQQDIDGGQAEADLQREMPSGWIANDFLTSSGTLFAAGVSNQPLTLTTPTMVAHVNGWLLTIINTNVTASGSISNQLTLTAGPSGTGATRTDLIILEVWRLLLSASPSVTGKSVSGRIWQNGNVKTDPSNDAGLNFPDDIKDTNVGSETTKRVQIQYRLRVIPGINLFANPYGMTDSAVVANTVPASASAPDGAPSTESFTYTNQSSNDDQGLWVAGDGNPANSLGTVDGYMYAIPFMAVFRRNTTAWNRITNQNGGAVYPGPSTRPDGYLSDIFEVRDFVDLRTAVSPTGWNYTELVTKNFQFLLDNNLQSEIATNTFGGGGINGAIIPWADEIGPVPSDGAGPLIGNFDAVRRRFSGRSIAETVTVAITAPGGGWTNGSTVTIDPTNLAVYPYAGFNWASFAPANVVISDFQDAWWLGTTGLNTINAMQYIDSVTNIGAVPTSALVVTFGALSALGLTTETLYVDLVIAYPTNVGLTKTPVNSYGANSFVLTGGTMPTSAPVSFASYANQTIDETHREVQLEYETSTLQVILASNTGVGNALAYASLSGGIATLTGLRAMYPALVGQQIVIAGSVHSPNNGTFTITGFISATSIQIANASAVVPDAGLNWQVFTNFIRLPERAATLVLVSVNATTYSAVLDTTGRIVTFATTVGSGGQIVVQYTALRPMPQVSEQMTIYYDAAAPQAARQALLGSSLQVIPRYVANDLYVITTGSGSQDEGYPWPQGYVQTGGIFPNSTNTYSGEADLSARGIVAITNFNASTGFLKLPLYLPMVANPDQITFSGPATDVEGRSYFNTTATGVYIPNAYAQDLSSANRHKDILPMLCELAADSPLGFQGQLVLVLFIRYALFDANNSINFDADQTVNTTVASVFRLRGNMLNKRAT